MRSEPFQVGSWQVEPDSGRLVREGQAAELQPVTMALLSFMAEHAGEVLSHDELLDGVWGDTVVSDNVIYWNINQLRSVLRVDGDAQTYIETLPRRGYRLVAPVMPIGDELDEQSSQAGPRGRWPLALGVFGLAIFALIIAQLDRGQNDLHAGGATLAILPFVSMSAQADDELFADGFTEELLNVVSRLENLRVISRTSSFYYKGRNLDLRDVGQALGAKHIVEGSIRRAKDRLRITVQLIDAESGHHRWSETYDRRSADTLDVQQDVAKRIARALQIRLTEEDLDNLQDVEHADSDAATFYEQATRMQQRRGVAPRDFEAYRSVLEQVLAIEPDHLHALYDLGFGFAMLRSIYAFPFDESVAPARDVLERMEAHGHEQSGEYQLLQAIVLRHEMSSWGVTDERISAIDNAYERAIAGLHNNTDPLLSYAIHARRLGDLEKASALLEQAAMLDPLDVGINLQLSRVLGATGRRGEALNRALSLAEHYPENPLSYTTVAEALFSFGDFAGAIDWLKRAPAKEGDNTVMLLQRLTYFAMGDIDRAVELIYQSGITPEEEALVSGIRQDWMAASIELDRLLANDPAPETTQEIRAGDAAYLAGRFEMARAHYSSAAPELLEPASASIHLQNYRIAIKLAATLQQTGETSRAAHLLKRLEPWIETHNRLGFEGYTISRAECLVLGGRLDEALVELESLFDEGWIQLSGTWKDSWYGQVSPILSGLEGQSGFDILHTKAEKHLAQLRQQAGTRRETAEAAAGRTPQAIDS